MMHHAVDRKRCKYTDRIERETSIDTFRPGELGSTLCVGAVNDGVSCAR